LISAARDRVTTASRGSLAADPWSALDSRQLRLAKSVKRKVASVENSKHGRRVEVQSGMGPYLG
jgi:hypothetical protein